MRATRVKGTALGADRGRAHTDGHGGLRRVGVGGVFNLGTTNTVNASTALQGTTNDQQLPRRRLEPRVPRSFGIGIHHRPGAAAARRPTPT